MTRLSTLVAAILVLATSPLLFAIPTYTGSISAPAGVDGTAPWDTDFQLSWDITDMGTYWCYEYTISSVTGGPIYKDPSHLIIEFSEAATSDNFWDVLLDGEALVGDQIEFGWFEAGPSNPDLPGAIYGLKMNTPNEFDGSFTYSLCSDKAPVWGNFYAKDGRYEGDFAQAWNADFTDSNPTDPAQNGLLSDGNDGYIYKILRPDTDGYGEVPEPGTLMLLGLGLLSSGWLAHRRRS